jgi:predicted nucleotidyltransferase
MSLSIIKEGELKEVFNALEEAFTVTGTDFYIIGALARDVWYARGQKAFRGTKDVDLAILVSSHAEYEAVRNYLMDHSQFRNTKENSFVMISPGGVQVDILPFGEIEIDDGITVQGEGMTSIKVNGFNEVYQSGTEEIELTTGHYFKIATLPAIVLLKLIAFDDRPDRRTKDARDIANIIAHFFDLQADLIYEKHTDLFADENDPRSLQDISAVVIGREMYEISKPNLVLHERLQRILNDHITRDDESPFVINMVTETKRDVQECVGWLSHMVAAFASKKQ